MQNLIVFDISKLTFPYGGAFVNCTPLVNLPDARVSIFSRRADDTISISKFSCTAPGIARQADRTTPCIHLDSLGLSTNECHTTPDTQST